MATRSKGIDMNPFSLRSTDREVGPAHGQLERIAERGAADERDLGAGGEPELHEAERELLLGDDPAHDGAFPGREEGQRAARHDGSASAPAASSMASSERRRHFPWQTGQWSDSVPLSQRFW